MPPVTNNRVVKRKRVVLSVEKKLQIVERVLNGEAFTKLSTEFGIAAQTCRDIFNTRDKLINFAFCSGTVSGCLKRKTLKKANFQDVDKAVYQWFQQQRSEGLPITGPMLIEKALWFHKEMKISEPFSASSGWLSKFKACYSIRQPKSKDDKLVSDEPLIDKFKSEFKRIVHHHNLTFDQIYLADEKVLFWNCLGSVIKVSDNGLLTISETNSDHEKIGDEFLTVMACSNANGSKKLKLFCTGRYEVIENHNDFDPKCVDFYHVVKGKTLYENALKDWFHNVFIPEVKMDLKEKALSEKAVLVIKIDDSINTEDGDLDEHILIESENDNFLIIFLPKVISDLPQMSLSSKDIIKHFIKSKLIPNIENCRTQIEIPFHETLSVLSDAWKSIKNECMQHSSWWWNNLFTEMENENLIEPRESVITHFMTSFKKIDADDDSLLFINPKIVVKTEVEEEGNIYDNNVDRKRLNYNLPVDNLITEFKVEMDCNEHKTVEEAILNYNIPDDYIKTKIPEKREYDFHRNSNLPINDIITKIKVKNEVNFNETNCRKQSLGNHLPTFDDAETESFLANNESELLYRTVSELEGNSNFENSVSPFQEIKLDNNGDCQKSGVLNNASSSRYKAFTTVDAIRCCDKLLLYLKQLNDSTYNDILVIGKIRKKLKNKIRNETAYVR